MTAVAQNNADGEMINLLGVFTDITERKIIDQQLLQAQKMESVGQLTGGLAHDFNNLLGVVLGNLQLIERTISSDDKTIRRLTAATDAVEKGAELTRRLLAFSRKQKLETESVAPTELVSGMSKLLNTMLGEGIELECILCENTPEIRTDPVQLESALMNLAANARDAMPNGGNLTIETKVVTFDEENVPNEHDVTSGTYVMIAVTDTGEGIPMDNLQNAFEPFFTTKEVGRGSGLGLSMVYGFTKQSGGHAKIYSEVNVGTTVRLYLPVDERKLDRDVIQQHKEKVDVLPGNGQLILVVEDQPEVREVAAGLLEDLGYRVLTADCGKSALMILAERDDIELMFTDMVMPGGIDGAELALRVRRIHPDMPIVFTTGYADAAVLREGKIKQSSNLVTKPYRRSELAEKIGYSLVSNENGSLNREEMVS
jgi:nitrogen-specific signal transduction histidine kinase/ActR/RegA family two-component response regulator